VLQPLGREGGEGLIAGWTRRRSWPVTGPIATFAAGSGASKTAGGGYRGSAILEAQWPSATGRRAGESALPPVGRRWTIGRRRGRDGCMKRRVFGGRRITRVEAHAGNATGGRDCRPDAGYERS